MTSGKMTSVINPDDRVIMGCFTPGQSEDTIVPSRIREGGMSDYSGIPVWFKLYFLYKYTGISFGTFPS